MTALTVTARGQVTFREDILLHPGARAGERIEPEKLPGGRLGRTEVRVTVDTNVLVRAVVQDDDKQGGAAAAVLRNAEIVAVPLPCLYELGAAAGLRFRSETYFRRAERVACHQ